MKGDQEHSCEELLIGVIFNNVADWPHWQGDTQVKIEGGKVFSHMAI
jgi:hypothetical protein